MQLPEGFEIQHPKHGGIGMLRRIRPKLNKHSVRLLTGQRRRWGKAARGA